MRILFLLILCVGFGKECLCQEKQILSNAIDIVSSYWKQDSISCKGYREKLAPTLYNSKVDSVTGKLLIMKLGQPNIIQKFYSGNTNKNYVGYRYFVRKDACPKIEVEGSAIEFVLDEHEQFVIEIGTIDYCR